MDLNGLFENDDEEEEQEEEEEEDDDDENFQIFPILESKCIKIDNLIEMNLKGFLFDSFIIIQGIRLEKKEQNIFQIHYNIILHY